VPHVLAPLSDVAVVFIASGPAACHCVAIDADGQLWTWGRNEVRPLPPTCANPSPLTSPVVASRVAAQNGQLGHGDRANRSRPAVVPLPAKAVSAACGRVRPGPACMLCPALAS
jgi:alpha-tubulin suppressor-like RCC1 family protein